MDVAGSRRLSEHGGMVRHLVATFARGWEILAAPGMYLSLAFLTGPVDAYHLAATEDAIEERNDGPIIAARVRTPRDAPRRASRSVTSGAT